MESDEITKGADGVARCWWPGADPEYRRYHDEEWGFPSGRNELLYEKICLEGFQSGLSWITILRKRDSFREVFHGFDYTRIAEYDDDDVERLMADARIVRNRRKILSTINNAKRVLELLDEFPSLATYFWQFEPPPEERPDRFTRDALKAMAKTGSSARLAKDLKKRGWTFIGPTTAYAFMQAEGIVNDHLDGCEIRAHVAEARAESRAASR